MPNATCCAKVSFRVLASLANHADEVWFCNHCSKLLRKELQPSLVGRSLGVLEIQVIDKGTEEENVDVVPVDIEQLRTEIQMNQPSESKQHPIVTAGSSHSTEDNSGASACAMRKSCSRPFRQGICVCNKLSHLSKHDMPEVDNHSL
eukprot:1227612-Rhodomonas_salina.1